jgi:hypothetical protein
MRTVAGHSGCNDTTNTIDSRAPGRATARAGAHTDINTANRAAGCTADAQTDKRESGRYPAATPTLNRKGLAIAKPLFLCAVQRHGLPAGVSPARQLSLQPVAIGAVVEVTKRLKPSV